MPNQQSTRRNQRAVKACSRCRKRKIKCDGAYPRCQPCLRVNVECLGYDARARQEQPRSEVASLETKVADLELRLLRLKEQAAPHRAINEAISLCQSTSPAFEDSKSPLTSLRSALYLSASPVPSLGLLAQFPRQTYDGTPGSHLPSIPRNVVDIMMRHYSDVYLAQYPIFEEEELLDACDKVYDGSASSFTSFIVYLALSISAHTLIRHDEDRALQSAEGFWRSALLHLNDILDHNSLHKLQALLLLSHYSYVNPARVNGIACSSAAMRLCLHLGLHQDATELTAASLGLTPNAWRRIFWTTYAFDSQLHNVSCRPYDLSSSSISTALPEPSSYDPSKVEKIATANHMYRWRRSETEINTFSLFPDWDQYYEGGAQREISDLAATRARIMNWRKTTEDQNFSSRIEFREVMFHINMLRTHRMSPRCPQPTFEMRTTANASAMALLRFYDQRTQPQRLFYIHQATWFVFEASIVLIEAIHAGLDLILTGLPSFLTSSDARDITAALTSAPGIMNKIASRHSNVSTPATELNILLSQTKARLEQWEMGCLTNQSPQELTACGMIRRWLCGQSVGLSDEAPPKTRLHPDQAHQSDNGRSLPDVSHNAQSNPGLVGGPFTSDTINYSAAGPEGVNFQRDVFSSHDFTGLDSDPFFFDAAGTDIDDIIAAFVGGNEYVDNF